MRGLLPLRKKVPFFEIHHQNEVKDNWKILPLLEMEALPFWYGEYEIFDRDTFFVSSRP
jgi:hypothetical protein